MSPTHWIRRQEFYWNTVAAEYDTLYKKPWSRTEDRRTVGMLGALMPKGNSRLLDLACGTGLGFEMCRSLDPEVQYVGLELSQKMLEKVTGKYPGLHVTRGVMSDLSVFPDSSFDFAMSLNTSFSYTDRPVTSLREIFRVLRPRGRILLSVLNRTSLRRITHFRRGACESYRTRSSTLTHISTPAWVFTPSLLRRRAERAGFSNVYTVADGAFSGVAEYRGLLPLDWIIGKLFPCVCNTINLVGTKPHSPYSTSGSI
jgi:ubiquinone/menaquinone biosynthesis C-methylase UbiE